MKNNLRNLREARRYTLRDVSEKTGVNYAVLSRLENQLQEISETYLRALADFYKVPTDYILCRETASLPQTIVYRDRDITYQAVLENVDKFSKNDLLKLSGVVDGALRRKSELNGSQIESRIVTEDKKFKSV